MPVRTIRGHREAMASPALRVGRCSQIGNVYALTTVTHQRRPWFEDAGNVRVVIESLRLLERQGKSFSYAWVVMPDHLHWLMQLRSGTLAGCMQLLKSRSGRQIAGRAREHRQVWQPGYYDHALRSVECIRRQALYIAANPVRAGLAERLGEYPFAWSRWRLA